MQNRITFSNVIGVLLENKKKTYAQYQMIEDIFYDCLCNMDLFEKEDFEKNVTYSRWCTGERPIPKEILSFYDNCGFDGIHDNIQEEHNKISPSVHEDAECVRISPENIGSRF